MGPPQPQKQPVNVSGCFVALAVVAGLGVLVLAVLFVFGWSFYRVAAVGPPTPAPMMKAVATTNGVTTATYTGDEFDVEIDREGNVSVAGERMTLEEVEKLFQERFDAAQSHGEIDIRVEEGCLFEHVQAVRDMYQRLGTSDPNLTTVPPRREVVVELDGEGKPTLDGEPAPDILGAFQEIAKKHGSRATLTMRVDPQCPFEVVSQIKELWTQSGLGDVKIADDHEPSP
jgi:biopolymer transport protein ExbD